MSGLTAVLTERVLLREEGIEGVQARLEAGERGWMLQTAVAGVGESARGSRSEEAVERLVEAGRL